MQIDYIVKEELWRSVGAVYWISFIFIGTLIMSGCLPISFAYLFFLALIPTAAHFFVVVWYRRKENLADPNPVSILRHALRSGEQGTGSARRRRAFVEKIADAVLVVAIFPAYLYASLASSLDQVFWLPILVVIGTLLARIVFIDGGECRITFGRSVVFYLTATAILLLRYLVLGYPVSPLLQGIVLVGLVFFLLLYLCERRRMPGRTD